VTDDNKRKMKREERKKEEGKLAGQRRWNYGWK
jgi:hypothetical protein